MCRLKILHRDSAVWDWIDSIVRPSYVVNVSPLQEKINKTIRNEPEVEYHKDNEAFLKTVLSEFKMLTGEADA